MSNANNECVDILEEHKQRLLPTSRDIPQNPESFIDDGVPKTLLDDT
jgi:hypothetical protein